jgi:flagellar M-ring protein FliF
MDENLDADAAALTNGTEGDAPDTLPSPEVLAMEEAPDPVARLRRLIEEREEETVQILRSWMEEDEELT